MQIKQLFVVALAALSMNAFAADHTVEMKNMGKDGMMVFEPAVLNVAVGDTVTFKATDPSHNAESVAGLIPKGATAWKGELNKDVRVTVDKAGVYVYQCFLHAPFAMVGVLVADKPVNLKEVKENSKALTAKFSANKDRLDKYLASVK